MATPRRPIVGILTCILIPLFSFVGCSLAGGVIGGIAGINDQFTTFQLTSGGIVQGTSLVIRKNDGTLLSGTFVGLRRSDEASYGDRYRAAVAGLKEAGAIPLPGDSILFAYSGAGVRPIGRGRFWGLDAGALLLGRTFTIPAAHRGIDLDSLRVLKIEGKGNIDLSFLRSLVSHRYLPMMTTHLILRDDADSTVSLPMEDIATVEVEHARYGWQVGLGVGAAIDCAILIMAFTSEWGTSPR